MDNLYPLLGIVVLALLILRFSWLRSFRRGRPVLASIQLLSTLSMLLLIVSIALLLLTTLGYQRLTSEQTLAHISIKKHGKQQFSADIEFAQGTHQSFEVRGDEIYIDARVLKWKPWANLLGFQSLYRLDRIGGRYIEYQQEMDKTRSLFQFKETTNEDLFDYRSEYKILAWLVDAEYGSAAFVPVEDQGEYLLTLSTSGLILRDLEKPLKHTN
jgi:hypothetical protein